MSAHIICVTSGGGLPIFSRKKGNLESLPFSTIGSLNGVHMFGKPLDIELLNTIPDDYSVTWKEYENSVILIGIASGCSVDILNKLLDSIFNATVLIVGLEEIKNQRNIDRLKRELRVVYPVLDRLLDCLDCGDSSNKHSTDIVQFVEIILCSENHLLQIVLDSFTESVDSMYSCILILGKVAVATECWWSLHPDEIKLLSLLASTEDSCNSKDIPVFLPYKSPNVAFRFVACTLIPNVQLCCLCGPTPVLTDVEHFATQCFKNCTEILNSAYQCSPKNFPATCSIDTSILGVLLVNNTLRKYMMSKSPHQNTSKKTGSSHRSDILRTFFYRAVLNNLITDNTEKTDTNTSDNDLFCNQTETYWCSEYHKCYALKENDNTLCILYNSSIPTHAMRILTRLTLKQLISEKQICW